MVLIKPFCTSIYIVAKIPLKDSNIYPKDTDIIRLREKQHEYCLKMDDLETSKTSPLIVEEGAF